MVKTVMKEPTFTVAVSRARQALREKQNQLNWFLWSSELAYGAVLTSHDARLSDEKQRISTALSDVQAEAWYPNQKGTVHYDVPVARFLEQLRLNTSHIYPAVLLAWFSHFERFLEERVRAIRGGEGKWGPLTHSLAIAQLQMGRFRLRPRTVVLADLVRVLRNEVVHSGLTTVRSPDHKKIKN